jgi:hypothetical protein
MKRCTGLFLSVSLALCAAVLVIGLLNCSVMTEFDKPLVLPPDRVCLNDEDCWSDEDPEYDCDVCDTDLHDCVPEGTNADGDDYFVCERALERGTADCDDTDDSIFPGAHEAVDLLDNDCDGIIDDGVLEAKDDEPDLIVKPEGACDDPCLWSSPRIGWAGPHIHAIWESDEGSNQDRLRVAQFDINGASELTQQLLVFKPGGDDHNMTEAGIAKAQGGGTRSHGAVWIDLLGGRTIDLMGFQFTTDGTLGIERTEQEWPDDQNVLRETHRDAAHPVIIARESVNEYFVVWSGRDAAETMSDIFLASFTPDADLGMTIDTSMGTDGFVNLSQTTGESEEGRPGLVQAGSGLVVAWIDEAEDAIRIVYMTDHGATAPDPGDIRTVPLPGIQGGSSLPLRDLVLVRSDQSVSTELAYLIFCGVPEGQTVSEVWAVSVGLNDFDSGSDAEVFGAPLRISESPAASSIEVAATWYDQAIGIAWSERRDGHNHIYFRRVARLETSSETSGVLASEEINLSTDMQDDTVNVYGQGPAIVAQDSDSLFAVMWWQRLPAGGGAETGDLYLRLVRPEG